MQFSKPMIELVYEIRRLAPSEMKPGIKLANPELFDELREHFHRKAKTVEKALIRELFSLAGEGWEYVLEEDVNQQNNAGHVTKMYRGVVSLEEKDEVSDSSKENASASPKKRIYRGQVVNG